MECLQNRINSFTKPKRVKNPAKPSSSVSLKWPHPPPPQFNATPETLAEAGFYFNPSFDDRDNVACFVCDKQLADWEAEDDPFDIHWSKCGDKCCWAIVRCGLRDDINRRGGFTFTEKSRVPTSKAMERARLETFSAGNGWIHDQVKNHGANSRKMARAGFVFTPQHAGDDLATCLYCNVALSGWEASDDPVAEHRKRQKISCPMFEADEPVSKPPSRALSTRTPSSSQPSKHSRSLSASEQTDFVQPMKTHDGDADESDAAPPPSSKRIRTASSSSKGAKTPKVPRSQSRSELKDIAEDDEGVETEEDVPRTGRAKAKKSMGATTKKTKSRSKSVAPGATSDDEEVVSRAPPRSRSRAKGKEKAVVDDDEPEEEIKVLKKSTRGRPPARVKEKDEDEQGVKVLKKSTRGRKLQNEEVEEEPEVQILKKSTRGRKLQIEEVEEEPGVQVLKKSTRGRPPPRIEKLEDDDEEVTKTVKRPTRTKTLSHVEDTATVPRKPSKTRKVKESEPKPEPESEPELETRHDVDMEVEEVIEEEERKPRAPSKGRVKTPATRKPSRTRPKVVPVLVEEEQEEEEVVSVPPPVMEKKKRVPSTSARVHKTSMTSGVARPNSTLTEPTAGTSGKATPALPEHKDDGTDSDADELEEALPLPETKKRVPSSSASAKPKAPQSKAKAKAPVPHPPSPEEVETVDDEDDEMDVFVSPRESPEPSPPQAPNPKEKDSDNEMESLLVPKRGAKPSSSNPSTKPTKAVDEDVDMEPVAVPRKAMRELKTQVAAKENKLTRESEMKGRKGSFLKVVEISTDEEGGGSDEEQPPQKSKPAPKILSPATEAKPMPEKPSVVVEPPPPPPADPVPSRKPIPPPPSPPRPSPPPTSAQPLQDEEMAPPEAETKPLIETQRAEPVVEISVPRTPSRAAAPPPKAPTPEPLFVPPLSKLPFTPLQNLTDAELDMTVEEWIRYQMEMEYDKFKRDGEREIGRFKKRAEEVKGVIEGL